jgi:hypothetical protein
MFIRALAAVDVLLKIIWPPALVPKLCKTLLLLATPVPLIISSPPTPGALGEMFKVKELDLEVNMMLFTSSDVEMFTSLCDDRAKVAISDGPLGGPPGVQLFAFSQAESCGDDSHVALPARLT